MYGGINLITLENITKEYKVGSETLCVLQNINLCVKQGEVLAIMGRSGCGKSTLLNIIGGIVPPTSGEVWIEGTRIPFGENQKLCNLRRSHIGYIVQNFALINRKTVFENVILPVQSREYRKNQYHKVKQLLQDFGIADKMNQYPYQLSNGEKQRVAIARALVDDKKIILADEPTGALDYANAESVITILNKLAKERNVTVLVVTHDKEIAYKCDRTLQIVYGKIENQ